MKFIAIVSSVILFVSCNSGAGKVESSDSANATQAIINTGGNSPDSANTAGSNLIAMNDCLTCHKINEKSFGPSYKQIANKYEYNEGNIQNLADRIIKGGKGLWGQNAMTPHPNITEPQAQAMSRYILGLRDTSSTK